MVLGKVLIKYVPCNFLKNYTAALHLSTTNFICNKKTRCDAGAALRLKHPHKTGSPGRSKAVPVGTCHEKGRGCHKNRFRIRCPDRGHIRRARAFSPWEHPFSILPGRPLRRATAQIDCLRLRGGFCSRIRQSDFKMKLLYLPNSIS